jgi:hypothetical protein
VTQGASTCGDANACTFGVSLACDGPEDCAAGAPVCCLSYGSGGGNGYATTCVASGGCSGGIGGGGVVCHGDGDCTTGTCQSAFFVDVRVCR